MKQFLLLLLVVCGLTGAATAGPCLPGSLQDYINLGAAGCSLGAANVSDFVVVPGQTFASPIDPSTVQITPVGGSLSRLDLFFDESALAGDLLESFFRFHASGQGLFLSGVRLSDAGATGDGVVTATSDTCAGGSFAGNEPSGCAGMAGSAVTLKADGISIPYDRGIFPATSFFDVFVDITIDGGLSGSANLGRTSVLVGVVPEPSQVLLMLTGLASLALVRVRKFHK